MYIVVVLPIMRRNSGIHHPEYTQEAVGRGLRRKYVEDEYRGPPQKVMSADWGRLNIAPRNIIGRNEQSR